MTSAQYSLFPSRVDKAGTGGEYDEMVSGDGRIRPHWRGLIGALQGFPEGVLGERVERIYRQYQDTALAFSVDDDRQTTEARRPFDVLPMVLTGDEFAHLEAGLAQRARLLDRLLADIYGARRVLTERLLPTSLIYDNPRFLRPCAGIAAAGPVSHLNIYCADLVRGPDGAWSVLADRLQAPSGIGFALQNRSILARTVPELFRAQAVRRIEPFFEIWRDSLAALAPQRERPARLVVLTPGCFNAAYFEHIYLARQLGATLAEGADLTVRDRRVYVKTLGALQPVDVILRFVEDDYCDALELRRNSMLGITGLLQAVRAGTVRVANALGSSVVETPALRPFLPRLTERFLGESLLLPSVETAWLGDIAGSAALPADMAIRPAFASRREEQAFVASFHDAGSGALRDEVRRHPKAYVAERRLLRSMMPIWTPGGLVPRPLVLRMYLAEREGAYFALPGGLTQVPHESLRGLAPLATVLASKDTWVLSGDDDGPVSSRPMSSAAVRQAPDELRSRSADDLFWLGRYSERLDNAARAMRSTLVRIVVEQLGPGQQHELHLLVRILAELGLVERSVAEWLPDSTALRRAIAQAGSRDHKLQDVFRGIRRISQSLRDRMSSDMWQVVNVLLRQARDRLEGDAGDVDAMIAALDHLVGVVAAFGGMASENMTRGTGWRFLDIGRRIERGVFGTTVLKHALTVPAPELEVALGLALELFDSAITYRSKYLSTIQPGPVLDLVVNEASNPRGIRFQLRAVEAHLRALLASFERPSEWHEEELVGLAVQALQDFPAGSLESEADEATLASSMALLDSTRSRLVQLSDAVTRAYFSQVAMPHPVGYEGFRDLIYAVRHRSSYVYQEMVDLSYHLLHLTPRELPYQRLIEASVTTTPAAPAIADGVDYFGNPIGFLSLAEPHERLVVELAARIEVLRRPPVDRLATPPWETVRDALAEPNSDDAVAAAEFVGASPLVPPSDAFADYAAPSFTPGRPLLDAVLDLTRCIHREFVFDPKATELTTPLTEVLERQRGVCQDFAHAEIAALRSLGLAARYVSGYIRTFGAQRGPRLVGADASHAWVAVWCPGLGWVDVDPTNNMVVDDEHIVLAWGRDYGDVSPICGVILGTGEHTLTVGVDVAPLE